MTDKIENLDELINLINENKTYKFKIKAVAGSKVNQTEFSDEFIKIKIKQKAVEGKANKAIIEYLSDILNIPKTKIEIVTGLTSPIKIVEVRL